MKIKDVHPACPIASGTTLYVDVLEKLKTHKSSGSRGNSVERTEYRIGDDTGHVIFLANADQVLSMKAKTRVKISHLEAGIKDEKMILMGTVEVTSMRADYIVDSKNNMSAVGYQRESEVVE